MARVRHSSLILFLVLAIRILGSSMCAASGLIEQAGAIPVALLFSNTDGTPCQQPCLLGIRPGETSFEEAGKLIEHHVLTHNFKPTNWSRGFVEGDVNLVIYEAVTKELKL